MLNAQIQSDVLLRSLLIALLIVAPYAGYKWRRLSSARRERLAAQEAAATAPAAPAPPELAEVIEHITRIGDAEEPPSAVTVPRGVRVDGAEAPPGLVDALVRDALRRSGLIATAEFDAPDGRVIEVARWRNVDDPNGS